MGCVLLTEEEMRQAHEHALSALRAELTSVREECAEEVNLAALEVRSPRRPGSDLSRQQRPICTVIAAQIGLCCSNTE